ncbi:MAG: hypothetical protein KGJ99_07325 [Betaproteobacteria bacterium]|nr:hypothetical protein [Betaproteobacteria bacterium]MDE2209518.1 hypothetical protein [Betaproteobacteria bacterium]
MHRQCVTAPAAGIRRLVLGAAFALGLACWLLPHAHVVRAAAVDGRVVVAQADPAQGAPAATKPAPTAATGPAPDASPPQAADASAGTGAPPPGAGNAGAKDNTDVDVSIGLLKGKNHIRVRGLGTDRNYDSFEQFAHDAPATALFVFLIVTVVFLVPLLIIALLVWYKIRKTRMHNETMLKLAERGVVTPAAAMEALAAGSSPGASFDATADPSTPQAAGGAPLYDQARRMQRRTAWSDLRKGVILTAIGLGLSAFSMFDDGTPNSVGLVLLFLGLGYCVLWFFEDRASGPRRNPPSPPAGGA